MARMTSPLASVIRGSIAGLTFLSNQYHQIVVRQRTAPVDPHTSAQASIRSAMARAEGAWASMTEADQADWLLYAQQTPFSGPLGNYTVTGRLMFMAGRTLNQYIFQQGYAVPSFDDGPPPIMAGFLNPSVVRTTPVGPGTGIACSVTADASTPTLAMMEVSPGFTKERKRYKGPWDTAKTVAVIIPAAASVVLEILGLVDGGIYFSRVKCVGDDAPVRISPAYINRHTAEIVAP